METGGGSGTMWRRNGFRKLSTLLKSRPVEGRRTSMPLSEFLGAARVDPPVLDARMMYAFFTHNKVAQTSVNRHVFRYRSIVRKDSWLIWRLALNRFARMWDEGQPHTFTIVRNPYFRTLSAFNYLRKIGTIEKTATFNPFVNEVLSVKGTSFDPHFMPQEKYARLICEMGFDSVIRFEDLDRGWAAMAGLIDGPAVLPHENMSTRRKPDRSLFADETLDVIERLYARDFECLGYERWARGRRHG